MIKNIFGASRLSKILGTFTQIKVDLQEFIEGNAVEIKELQDELQDANAEQVQAKQALAQINKIVGA